MTRTPVQRTQSIADEQLQMSTPATPGFGNDTGKTQPYTPPPDVGSSRNFDPCDVGSVLVCQDNIEFMAGLPGGSMKLIVTSPPYNIGKLYEERAPLDSYVKGQARVIAECVRLLHPNGSLCWQVGNFVEHGEVVPLDTLLYPLFKEHGLKLRNRIVWHFEHGLHCTSDACPAVTRLSTGLPKTTSIRTTSIRFVFRRNTLGKRHFKGPKIGRLSGNPRGKNPGDVWIFPNVKSNHVEKTIHPCQFPVELVERLVLSMTAPGDAVSRSLHGRGNVYRRGTDARTTGIRLRYRQ